MAKLTDAGTLWEMVLGELQLQMTRATFDTWLRGSRGVGRENGTLRVEVRHVAAVEWLENRLEQVVLRTVRRHDESVERVAFGVVGAARVADLESGEQEAESDALADEEPGDGQVDVELVSDPELARFDIEVAGWSKLANYATQFWSELLGPAAFLTWLAVKAEDIRRQKTSWTPALHFSVSRLARVAAGGNNQAITGVWRMCRSRNMVERNEPCAQCQARGGEVVEPCRCRYWRPGAFDVLQAEGIAVVQRRGEGLSTSYRVRVFNVLPLLAPRQVKRLHGVSQEEHDRWLSRQHLDLERWERLSVDHLVLERLDNIH
jgi:hypothetical protein